MSNVVKLIGIITAIPGAAATAGGLLYRAVVSRNDKDDFDQFCTQDFSDVSDAAQYCDTVAKNTANQGVGVELTTIDTTDGGKLDFIASDWFIGTSLTITAIGIGLILLSKAKPAPMFSGLALQS